MRSLGFALVIGFCALASGCHQGPRPFTTLDDVKENEAVLVGRIDVDFFGCKEQGFVLYTMRPQDGSKPFEFIVDMSDKTFAWVVPQGEYEADTRLGFYASSDKPLPVPGGKILSFDCDADWWNAHFLDASGDESTSHQFFAKEGLKSAVARVFCAFGVEGGKIYWFGDREFAISARIEGEEFIWELKGHNYGSHVCPPELLARYNLGSKADAIIRLDAAPR